MRALLTTFSWQELRHHPWRNASAVVAELEAEGVEFVPTSSAVGQVWIRDPDGNVIELIRPGGRLGR